MDIDDIFVGSARLAKSDVTALVESQNNLSKAIPGFHYNLGSLVNTSSMVTKRKMRLTMS